MTFYTKYTQRDYILIRKADTLSAAYYMILHYPMGADEKILDAYCRKNYNLPLKFICLKLVAHLKDFVDYDGKIVWKTKTIKDDKLARLITFGDGRMHGSKILVNSIIKGESYGS